MNQIFIAIDMHECELSYYIKKYGSVQQIHVFLNHFLFLYNKKLQTLFLKSVAYLFLFSIFSYIPSKSHTAKSLPSCSSFSYLLGYALDRLVTVSSMHYCTSTSVLSTLSSSRGLTTFVGISHLEGGFTLRCLQRLSLPDLATLPCLWQDNRFTSGRSSPVLSY